MLSDLWFLQVAPQYATNAPGTRGCIYPFSFYHLHGIFQFFTYGIIFPIGYLVGRHAGNSNGKRRLHIGLQVKIDFVSISIIKLRLCLAFWCCISYLWFFFRCIFCSCTSMASFSTCSCYYRYYNIYLNYVPISCWIVSKHSSSMSMNYFYLFSKIWCYIPQKTFDI